MKLKRDNDSSSSSQSKKHILPYDEVGEELRKNCISILTNWDKPKDRKAVRNEAEKLELYTSFLPKVVFEYPSSVIAEVISACKDEILEVLERYEGDYEYVKKYRSLESGDFFYRKGRPYDTSCIVCTTNTWDPCLDDVIYCDIHRNMRPKAYHDVLKDRTIQIDTIRNRIYSILKSRQEYLGVDDDGDYGITMDII